MIAFIHGQDARQLDRLVDQKRKLYKAEGSELVVINGDDSSFNITDLMMEASTLSFFFPRKFIIMKNFPGFNTRKVLDDASFNEVESLLNKPPYDCDIVFTLNGNAPDGKRKLTKLFKKHTDYQAIENNQKTDIQSLIWDFQKSSGISMTNDALSVLKKYCINYGDVASAFDKLALLDGEINATMVEKLVQDRSQSMIYDLSEALLKQDRKRVFTLYQKLTTSSVEPIQIIYHLAGKYRQYYQLFTLQKSGMSANEISKRLKMSERQVYFILNNHRSLTTPKQCLRCLNALANIDQEAKRGKIDFKLGIELFLIKELS